MNFKNYTIKSQEVIQQAQQIAQSFQNQHIENTHILKAILEIDQQVTPFLLKKYNLPYSTAEGAVACLRACGQSLQSHGWPRTSLGVRAATCMPVRTCPLAKKCKTRTFFVASRSLPTTARIGARH